MQLASTILIKLLLIVTHKQKTDLKNDLKNINLIIDDNINNEIIIKIEQFQKKMFLRRFLGSIIMLFVIIFFFIIQ